MEGVVWMFVKGFEPLRAIIFGVGISWLNLAWFGPPNKCKKTPPKSLIPKGAGILGDPWWKSVNNIIQLLADLYIKLVY